MPEQDEGRDVRDEREAEVDTSADTGRASGDEAGGGPRPEEGGPEDRSAEREERSRREAGKDAWDRAFSELHDVVGDIIGSIRNIPSVGGRQRRHDLIRVPGEGYWVLIDLPGVERADLEVTTVGEDRAVVGERRRPELPEGSEVLGFGRGYGSFRQEIRIPSDVDPTGIRAKLEGGVLKLVLPRRTEAQRVHVTIEE